MKSLKYMATMLIACSAAGFVQAKSTVSYPVPVHYLVPFYNVIVPAGDRLLVDYSFEPSLATLACRTDKHDDAITTVRFNYRDIALQQMLPVLLKANVNFPGTMANPKGTLVITNEFGSSRPNGEILASCEYRYINH